MSKQAAALRSSYGVDESEAAFALVDPIAPGKKTATQDTRRRGPAASEPRIAALRDHHLPALRAAKDPEEARAAARLVRLLLSQLGESEDTAALRAEAEAALALAPPEAPASSAGLVQRFSSGPDLSADTHAHAQAGVAGTGGALPHAAAIQASFGAHDISGIRAHVGGPAATASAAIGAEAYATGTDVAFASSPSLFVAAHEAAHVVQQRAGVSLLGGVGEAGDSYEQHADAVAAKVVAGESAEALLGASSGPNSTASDVQLKAKPEQTFLLLQLDAIAATAVEAVDRIDEYRSDGESAYTISKHVDAASQDALGEILDRLSNLREVVPSAVDKKLMRAAKNAAASVLALLEIAKEASADVGTERDSADTTFALLGVQLDAIKPEAGHARFTSKERRQAVGAALEAATSRISHARKREPANDLNAAASLINQAESDARDGKVPGAKKLVKTLSAVVSDYDDWSREVGLPEDARDSLASVHGALEAIRAQFRLPAREEAPKVRVTAHETPKTGVALVDEGTVCEQDNASEDCYLSYGARSRLIDVLGDVVESSLDNYSIALQDAQLDRVLQKEGSWGPLSEILFFAVSGPLIGVAMNAVKMTKAAIAAKKAVDALDIIRGKVENDVGPLLNAISKVPDGVLQEGLQLSSKGLRQALKNASRAGSDNQGQAAFLKIMKEQIKPMKDSLKIDVPATLTDAGLSIMFASYRNEDAHSVAVYGAKVGDLLARYHGESVDRIGEKFKDGGVVRTIVLVASGQRRHAILAEHGTGYIGMHGHGESRGEFKFGDGIDYFLSFVDDELAPMAAGIHEAKAGAQPETIDVSDGSFPFAFAKDKMEEVTAWVHDAKAQGGNSQVDSGNPDHEEPAPVPAGWPQPDPQAPADDWHGNHF